MYEFAQLFDEKVKSIVEVTTIDLYLYNGECIITSNTNMFMDESSEKECIFMLDKTYVLSFLYGCNSINEIDNKDH